LHRLTRQSANTTRYSTRSAWRIRLLPRRRFSRARRCSTPMVACLPTMGLTSVMFPWRTPTPSRPQSRTIRSQGRGDPVKKIRALQVRSALVAKKKRRHQHRRRLILCVLLL
ncbi:hypothetical protein JG688_00003184, partial [Phytophthora aleatoria]